MFNGEPVLAPVGTSLSAAVNTNWDVFFNADNRTWYLLNNGGWLAAPDYRGPWAPPRRLPAAFYTIPSDANFAKVRAQVPGRSFVPEEAPAIFVSTVPAEIIVTAGAPQYQRIPGTALRFVANTVADLFQDTSTGTFYYLVSGRWFAAPALTGPWVFATPSLPPDFARIPANGPRGSVLASVPGTPQAQEALLHAQVPQQGTLSRATAQIDVRYGGEPRVRADSRHHAPLRGEHVVRRDPRRRHVLRVLAGCVVPRADADRPVGARRQRPAGRLHDSAE